MTSVIKVESFDVNVSTDGSTHTLTNDVASLTNAFIRRPGPSDKCSGGPVGNTGNIPPRDTHCGMAITSTDTITFYKNTSVTVKVIGEVWRYTGFSGGPDEFIVRAHTSVSMTTSTSGSVSVAGIVNKDRCVPFITGIEYSGTSVNDYNDCTVNAYINGSGDLVCERGNTTGDITVYVDVVEFTGSNWSIGHGISNSHDITGETVTLNSSSTGSGGSTFSVSDWSEAFLEINMQGDTAETGITDCLILAEPGGTTSTVDFILHTEAGARNDGSAYVHVINHPNLIVTRTSNDDISEGNNTYGTLSFPAGTSVSESLDELGLEFSVRSTGTGTAHARGRLNARITDPAGTIQHWVHRLGNTVAGRWGVINLSGVDDPGGVTPTPTPTATVTPSATVTPTATVTPSATVTPTVTITPSVTPTITPTPSVSPAFVETNTSIIVSGPITFSGEWTIH